MGTGNPTRSFPVLFCYNSLGVLVFSSSLRRTAGCNMIEGRGSIKGQASATSSNVCICSRRATSYSYYVATFMPLIGQPMGCEPIVAHPSQVYAEPETQAGSPSAIVITQLMKDTRGGKKDQKNKKKRNKKTQFRSVWSASQIYRLSDCRGRHRQRNGSSRTVISVF
jgi:hypothetical protein